MRCRSLCEPPLTSTPIQQPIYKHARDARTPTHSPQLVTTECSVVVYRLIWRIEKYMHNIWSNYVVRSIVGWICSFAILHRANGIGEYGVRAGTMFVSLTVWLMCDQSRAREPHNCFSFWTLGISSRTQTHTSTSCCYTSRLLCKNLCRPQCMFGRWFAIGIWRRPCLIHEPFVIVFRFNFSFSFFFIFANGEQFSCTAFIRLFLVVFLLLLLLLFSVFHSMVFRFSIFENSLYIDVCVCMCVRSRMCVDKYGKTMEIHRMCAWLCLLPPLFYVFYWRTHVTLTCIIRMGRHSLDLANGLQLFPNVNSYIWVFFLLLRLLPPLLLFRLVARSVFVYLFFFLLFECYFRSISCVCANVIPLLYCRKKLTPNKAVCVCMKREVHILNTIENSNGREKEGARARAHVTNRHTNGWSTDIQHEKLLWKRKTWRKTRARDTQTHTQPDNWIANKRTKNEE